MLHEKNWNTEKIYIFIVTIFFISNTTFFFSASIQYTGGTVEKNWLSCKIKIDRDQNRFLSILVPSGGEYINYSNITPDGMYGKGGFLYPPNSDLSNYTSAIWFSNYINNARANNLTIAQIVNNWSTDEDFPKKILESERIDFHDKSFWKVRYSEKLPEWMGNQIDATLFIPITKSNPEKMEKINIGYTEKFGKYNNAVIDTILQSQIETGNKPNEVSSKVVLNDTVSWKVADNETGSKIYVDETGNKKYLDKRNVYYNNNMTK